MFNQPMQQPVNVAAGATATLTIKAGLNQTLVGLKLLLGGTTFDKTKVDFIRVKIGPKLIWDLLTADLNVINNYKGNADGAQYLYLDFSERDQALFPDKEIGGIDLTAILPYGDVIVEVGINAAAVAPTITATGYFEVAQGNPLVLKYLRFPTATAVAGKFTLPLSFRGSMLKRVFHRYAGTNFSATTNGNINRVEVKKNSMVIFDQRCLDARFDQVQFKKTPQANTFITDFIIDNNHAAQVPTVRSQNGALIYDNFEFNTFLTAGDSISNIVEVLDTVTNL